MDSVYLLNQLVRNGLVRQHQLDGGAALARVREAALHDVLCRQVKVCVLQGISSSKLVSRPCFRHRC